MGQPRRPDQNYSPPTAVTPPSPSSGVFIGRFVQVSGNAPASGIYVYTPTPGEGNLIGSIAAVTSPATQGEDRFGDTVYPVVAVYGLEEYGTAGQAIQLGSIPGEVAEYWKSGAASEAASGNVTTDVNDEGDANEQIIWLLNGPQSTASPQDYVSLYMYGSPANAAGEATLFAAYTSDLATVLRWEIGATGFSRYDLPGLLSGGVPLTVTDTFQRTVTEDTSTELSRQYNISANDAVNGLGFRVRAFGYGVQGDPAQDITISLVAYGTTFTSVTFTTIPESHDFGFIFDSTVQVVNPGASGTAQCSATLTFTDTTAITPIGPITGVSSLITVDTTAATTIGYYASWASTSGSPTITCTGSEWFREGQA